ncbi:MAG: GNAT family N-acetyltransferase [Pseudomonadota bacterium]|nr:GNAT family N-acetyltransferase [Pseudomonadota bacterium]
MIETPRLLLRDWREADVAPFIAHTNTPAVMRWLGGVKTDADMREVTARLMRWQEERGFTFWVVERKEDSALLGFCGLKIADCPGSSVPGAIEIGWRLREDVWGQGYAKEAAAATLAHSFDTLEADRVVAITVQGNAPSWGLMRRLGMTYRDDLDYDDPRFPALNPAIVYEVTRAAFTAR